MFGDDPYGLEELALFDAIREEERKARAAFLGERATELRERGVALIPNELGDLDGRLLKAIEDAQSHAGTWAYLPSAEVDARAAEDNLLRAELRALFETCARALEIERTSRAAWLAADLPTLPGGDPKDAPSRDMFSSPLPGGDPWSGMFIATAEKAAGLPPLAFLGEFPPVPTSYVEYRGTGTGNAKERGWFLWTDAIKDAHRRVALAFHWSSAFRGWLENDDTLARLAARREIYLAANEHKDEVAEHPEAERRLMLAVLERITDARRATRVPKGRELAKLDERSGMFPLDAALSDFIDALPGGAGHNLAAQMREAYREKARQVNTPGSPPLCERWTDPLHLPRALAQALWSAVVRPALELEQRKPRALSQYAFASILPTTQPGARLEGDPLRTATLIGADGSHLAKIERTNPLDVAHVELEALSKLLPRGVELLSTLNAHRVLRYEITMGHRRFLENVVDARVLRIPGGWSGLAQAAGASVDKRNDMHAIVAIQAHLCFKAPDGSYGNLLSYRFRPEKRGQRSELTLILGDMLLPEFVRNFTRKSLADREARRLIPVVDLPPLTGRPNEQGAQAALQLYFLAELRRRVGELVQDGGVLLTDDDWGRLAAQASLPVSLLPRVRDCWLTGDDERPPFLEKPEEHRYNLSCHHESAREFLSDAWRKEQAGRENGLRGAARRARKRRQ